jgi:shikimate kinase
MVINKNTERQIKYQDRPVVATQNNVTFLGALMSLRNAYYVCLSLVHVYARNNSRMVESILMKFHVEVFY